VLQGEIREGGLVYFKGPWKDEDSDNQGITPRINWLENLNNRYGPRDTRTGLHRVWNYNHIEGNTKTIWAGFLGRSREQEDEFEGDKRDGSWDGKQSNGIQ